MVRDEVVISFLNHFSSPLPQSGEGRALIKPAFPPLKISTGIYRT